MNKKLILFSHHYADDFVKWNYENTKKLNSDWDVIPIGFPGYQLLPNSVVVDKSKYPTNFNVVRKHPDKHVDWADPDLFIYDGYFQFPNYEMYFLLEYDTISNVSVDKFFDMSLDFFGNNLNHPAAEDWYWVELYRECNPYSVNFKTLYGYGQSTCIFFKNEVLKKCYLEVTSNKHFYTDMLSEIRGGTLVKQFTELKKPREDIRDFIWWETNGLKFGQNEYFYHPIKNFTEAELILK
jgi:hypothetical protein